MMCAFMSRTGPGCSMETIVPPTDSVRTKTNISFCMGTTTCRIKICVFMCLFYFCLSFSLYFNLPNPRSAKSKSFCCTFVRAGALSPFGPQFSLWPFWPGVVNWQTPKTGGSFADRPFRSCRTPSAQRAAQLAPRLAHQAGLTAA